MEPDAVEIRVLGCLIEKQRTTPDVYPLTLNALRLACNQSTNRDPVVEYDENTIRSGIERLVERKWATLASWSNRRSMKYRHTLDGALGVDDGEIAVLAVLMLRGPQTPGELKTRTERLHGFGDTGELNATLARLIERNLVASLGKRPGQREERYAHLLAREAEAGEPAPEAPAAEPGAAAPESRAAEPPPAAAPETRAAGPPPAAASGAPAAAPLARAPEAAPAEPLAETAPPDDGVAARVERLEQEVAALREELRSLREELRSLREELGA